jgi:hypothetical protein
MRYELSDYEWTAIKPMLPSKPRALNTSLALARQSRSQTKPTASGANGFGDRDQKALSPTGIDRRVVPWQRRMVLYGDPAEKLITPFPQTGISICSAM